MVRERRQWWWLVGVMLSFAGVPLGSPEQRHESLVVSRIAFGSCANQSDPQVGFIYFYFFSFLVCSRVFRNCYKCFVNNLGIFALTGLDPYEQYQGYFQDNDY